MFAKFKLWYGKLNEMHFNILYIAITIGVTLLATQFGFVSAEIIAGILMKTSIYVATTVIFIRTLMGLKFDILAEIKDEHNIALAILLAGFMCGLGFSIGGL